MEEQTMYEKIGGEQGLRRLVERFYHHMDNLPEVKLIRDMHQPDLADAADKLFCFLSGWTGGPALFHEKYGHPMLRRRHFPFAIDKAARDQWMYCMINAIDDLEIPDPIAKEFATALYRLADHMRNREEPEG